MTDRIYALTVLLEEPVREDDVETLIQAIKQMRGVLDVTTRVANIELYWARVSAGQEVIEILLRQLHDFISFKGE